MLGSCVLFGDNMSMITSATIPSSSLKKKHNAISYHRIRECIAAGIIDLVHVGSKVNLADVLTKPLGPNLFSPLLSNFRFSIIGRPKTTHDGECQREMATGPGMTPGLGSLIGIRDWSGG